MDTENRGATPLTDAQALKVIEIIGNNMLGSAHANAILDVVLMILRDMGYEKTADYVDTTCDFRE